MEGKGTKIFAVFQGMFPKMAEKVDHYRLIGSAAIAVYFVEGIEPKSLVFLYKSKTNWQLGTKLYRKVPEAYERKRLNKKQNNEDNNNIFPAQES